MVLWVVCETLGAASMGLCVFHYMCIYICACSFNLIFGLLDEGITNLWLQAIRKLIKIYFVLFFLQI